MNTTNQPLNAERKALIAELYALGKEIQNLRRLYANYGTTHKNPRRSLQVLGKLTAAQDRQAVVTKSLGL